MCDSEHLRYQLQGLLLTPGSTNLDLPMDPVVLVVEWARSILRLSSSSISSLLVLYNDNRRQTTDFDYRSLLLLFYRLFYTQSFSLFFVEHWTFGVVSGSHWTPMSAGYLARFQKTTIVLLPVSREVCYGRFSVSFFHALLDLIYITGIRLVSFSLHMRING